jgi:hypothetical protein
MAHYSGLWEKETESVAHRPFRFYRRNALTAVLCDSSVSFSSFTGSSAEGSKARTLANEREAAEAAYRQKQELIKKQNQVKLHDMSRFTDTNN